MLRIRPLAFRLVARFDHAMHAWQLAAVAKEQLVEISSRSCGLWFVASCGLPIAALNISQVDVVGSYTSEVGKNCSENQKELEHDHRIMIA